MISFGSAMRYLVLALLCVEFTSSIAAPIERQGNNVPKMALLIGNAVYQQDRYSLNNPINDIELIAQSLHKLGFVVSRHTNLGRVDMHRTVSDFAASVPAGATTFIYYAGHGMQIGGESYLIPTDMPLTSEQAVAMRALPLAAVLEKVSRSRAAVNVVVLDACRNNPFQPRPDVRYRGVAGFGLAQIKAPRGTLIAYSTAPNQQAPDGNGINSLYAKALASSLLHPGQTLIDTFKSVGQQVRKSTYDDQIPWFASSLNDDYYFLPPASISVVTGQSPVRSGTVSSTFGARGGVDASAVPAWYKVLTENEWTDLDWEIQQRVKRLTADELPTLERLAQSGNVVAQTTLGLAWREGIHRAANAKTAQIIRYGANNSKAVKWLQRAANADFAVAQVELAEMYYTGTGIARDVGKARFLLAQANQTSYPRAHLNSFQLEIEELQISKPMHTPTVLHGISRK